MPPLISTSRCWMSVNLNVAVKVSGTFRLNLGMDNDPFISFFLNKSLHR